MKPGSNYTTSFLQTKTMMFTCTEFPTIPMGCGSAMQTTAQPRAELHSFIKPTNIPTKQSTHLHTCTTTHQSKTMTLTEHQPKNLKHMHAHLPDRHAANTATHRQQSSVGSWYDSTKTCSTEHATGPPAASANSMLSICECATTLAWVARFTRHPHHHHQACLPTNSACCLPAASRSGQLHATLNCNSFKASCTCRLSILQQTLHDGRSSVMPHHEYGGSCSQLQM
jgi:hypothetical protein